MSAIQLVNKEEINQQETLMSLGIYKTYQNKRAQVCDCGICGESYRPTTRFDRFCDRCREESELYHFAEWMLA